MQSGSTRGRATTGTLVGICAALVLIVLLMAQSAIPTTSISSIARTETTTTVVTRTAVRSIFSTLSIPATPSIEDCLLPVEANASLSGSGTAEVEGTLVAYAPGDQVFYPDDECPQPVSNETYSYVAIDLPSWSRVRTDNYELALAAVTNKTFIGQENGSTYLYSQPCSSPLSSESSCHLSSEGNSYLLTLIFYRYSSVSQAQCGDTNQMRRVVLSGIEVTFSAAFGGSWDLSNPQIQMMSQSDVSLDNGCGVGV
jgi:hypothetical protein